MNTEIFQPRATTWGIYKRAKGLALAARPLKCGAMAFVLLAIATACLNVARAEGAHEGIKVHGHWTIDVRNPDGTVARHADFENGLCLGVSPNRAGDSLLGSLLAGTVTPGTWSVVLGNNPIPSGATPGLPCAFIPVFELDQADEGITNECAASNLATGCFTSLTVNSQGVAQILTLAGQFTVPATYSSTIITSVGTYAATCLATLLVSQCVAQTGGSGFALPFTAAYLTGINGVPGPITVVAGQVVSVTVQISFH